MSLASSSPRVLIVDDDPRVGQFLTEILEQSGYSVESIINLDLFFDKVSPENLSCVLLDIQFASDQDGASLYLEMLDRGWNVPVIFVSAFGTIPIAVSMIRAGALDVLSKVDVSDDPNILLKAVEKAVATSREWREEESKKRNAHALLQKLTPREVETLQWMLTGRLNKQTAAELGITERTVIAHRRSLMKKVGAISLIDLFRLAAICGVLPADVPDDGTSSKQDY